MPKKGKFNGPSESFVNHSVACLYPCVPLIGLSFAHEKTWWVMVATHRSTWPDAEKYLEDKEANLQEHNQKGSESRTPDHSPEGVRVLKNVNRS